MDALGCERSAGWKYRPDDFFQTDLGGLVVCEDKALIYEEDPQAYKNSESSAGDRAQRKP